jgi:hypothetical protein
LILVAHVRTEFEQRFSYALAIIAFKGLLDSVCQSVGRSAKVSVGGYTGSV